MYSHSQNFYSTAVQSVLIHVKCPYWLHRSSPVLLKSFDQCYSACASFGSSPATWLVFLFPTDPTNTSSHWLNTCSPSPLPVFLLAQQRSISSIFYLLLQYLFPFSLSVFQLAKHLLTCSCDCAPIGPKCAPRQSERCSRYRAVLSSSWASEMFSK
jgi:hypothetical protein